MVGFIRDKSSTPGAFAPTRFEADIEDCETVGTVPDALDGAFIRAGGEWFYPPKFPNDAPFSMDGHVSAFRFKRGRVDYKGRWVKTPRFLANRAAGRQLFGIYRNRLTDEPQVRGLDGTVSNTNTLAHAGRLFTLKEDGLPYQIDPDTLDTMGPWNFGGGYEAPTFTAHPKRDPETGELIAYGYEATGPASDDLYLYAIDRNGAVTREQRLKMPYVSMVHDIAITPRHVVIPVYGLVTSRARLEAGQIHWGWDKNAPVLVGIVPRDGEARDLRWFKAPPSAVIHTLNARDEGSKVILELAAYPSNPFPFFPNIDGSPWDPKGGQAFIRRWSFDLAANDDRGQEEILVREPVTDLARIDERSFGRPYRYVFAPYHDAARPFDADRARTGRPRVNCYGRFDLATGNTSTYFAGETHTLQEPCFVPRRPDAAEGDGYLLGVATDFAVSRSELVILDAQHLDEGAIARVILPFHITPQVHANWMAADELPFLS
jgi:carotenoid cleavage dioxygenase-like enzyme